MKKPVFKDAKRDGLTSALTYPIFDELGYLLADEFGRRQLIINHKEAMRSWREAND